MECKFIPCLPRISITDPPPLSLPPQYKSAHKHPISHPLQQCTHVLSLWRRMTSSFLQATGWAIICGMRLLGSEGFFWLIYVYIMTNDNDYSQTVCCIPILCLTWDPRHIYWRCSNAPTYCQTGILQSLTIYLWDAIKDARKIYEICPINPKSLISCWSHLGT